MNCMVILAPLPSPSVLLLLVTATAGNGGQQQGFAANRPSLHLHLHLLPLCPCHASSELNHLQPGHPINPTWGCHGDLGGGLLSLHSHRGCHGHLV